MKLKNAVVICGAVALATAAFVLWPDLSSAIPCREGIADECQGRMPGIDTNPDRGWLQWLFE